MSFEEVTSLIEAIVSEPESAQSLLQVSGFEAIDFLFHCKPQDVKFILSCYPSKLHVEYLIDLINERDENKSLCILPKLDPHIDLPLQKLKLLVMILREDDENDSVKDYVKTKIAQANIKPKWVRQFNQVEIVQAPLLPSVYEAVNLLWEDLQKLNIEMETFEEKQKVKDHLICEYAISTTIEKIQMLSHLKEIPMFNDIPLFREFGPVNCIYSRSEYDPDHICSKYGGCRMFLCTEFEEVNEDLLNEESDVEVQWFYGYCDNCNKSISQKHFALRLPLLHGGWKGCYCSFRCLEGDVEDENTATIVGRMKEQLQTIGIRDR